MSDPKQTAADKKAEEQEIKFQAAKTMASVEQNVPGGQGLHNLMIGEELLETAGTAIRNQLDKMLHISEDVAKIKEAAKEAAADLKKHICGCSNEKEPQSTHSIPTAKPAHLGRE
jgi:hypothetical protein